MTFVFRNKEWGEWIHLSIKGMSNNTNANELDQFAE